MRRDLLWCVPLIAALGCASAAPTRHDPAIHQGPRVAPLEPWAAEMAAAMDPNVDPCVDFYSYACGGWLATDQLPSGYDAWDRGHTAALATVRARVRAGLALRPTAGSPVAAAQAFFAACEAGTAADERVSLAPLLARIDQVVDLPSLMRTLGYLHSAGIPAFFLPMPLPHEGDVLFVLMPTRLSFPPLVYTRSDAVALEKQPYFIAYIAKLLRAIADPAIARPQPPSEGQGGGASGPSEAQAAQAFELEASLARIMTGATNPSAPVPLTPMSRAELQLQTPGVPWSEYFASLGLPHGVPLGVLQPAYFAGLERELAGGDPAVWRQYLRWQMLYSLGPWLGTEAARDWAAQPLRGMLGLSLAPPPRWNPCVDATESIWPEAVEILARPTEDPGVGEIADQVAPRVARGLAGAVSASTWMDDATRAEAQRKLESAGWLVRLPQGAAPRPPPLPEPDPSDPNGFIALLCDARRKRFEWSLTHFDLARTGAIAFTRHTSHPLAIYQLGSNVIEVSPTLLESPYLAADRPMALNFAVFGTVVGHELSHALGPGGRAVDADKQRRDWWSTESAERYGASSACMTQVYDAFEIQAVDSAESLSLNGARTLEENIADLGGIAAAHQALTTWRVENPLASDAASGLEDEQIFFLGFAQSWCQQTTQGGLLATVFFDDHAPGRFRVNGPLAQFPPFAQAFHCSATAPMVARPSCGLFGGVAPTP